MVWIYTCVLHPVVAHSVGRTLHMHVALTWSHPTMLRISLVLAEIRKRLFFFSA